MTVSFRMENGYVVSVALVHGFTPGHLQRIEALCVKCHRSSSCKTCSVICTRTWTSKGEPVMALGIPTGDRNRRQHVMCRAGAEN